MRPLALAAAFAALVAVSAPVTPVAAQKKKPADDEFPIIIAGPRVKEKVEVVVDERVNTTLTIVVKGEKKEYKEKTTKDFKYTDEILAAVAGARLPTHIKRIYEKAVIDDGKVPKSHPLEHQHVTIEKRGGNFIYIYDKKSDLDNDQKLEAKAELDIEFNTLNKTDLRDVVFPESLSVKNNGKWDIAGKAITNILFQDTLKLDESKIKAHGEVKNAKPDKKPNTAQVIVTVTAPVTEFSFDKKWVKAKEPSKLTLTLDGNGRIDGVNPDGTIKIECKLKLVGTAADGTELDIDTTATETRTTKLIEAKKDKN